MWNILRFPIPLWTVLMFPSTQIHVAHFVWGCCWSHVLFPERCIRKHTLLLGPNLINVVHLAHPCHCLFSCLARPLHIVVCGFGRTRLEQFLSFLAQWDVPGSSCIFPASALESAFSPMILSSFWWKTEFRCDTWHQVWHCYWCAIVCGPPQQRCWVEASMSVWIYCFLTAGIILWCTEVIITGPCLLCPS